MLAVAVRGRAPKTKVIPPTGGSPSDIPSDSSRYVYIVSSALASLPAAGNRIDPTDEANMFTLVGSGSPHIALQTASGAHHFRIIGAKFKPASGTAPTALVRVGSGITSLVNMPNNIIFDRCIFSGDATVGGNRGLHLEGARNSVIDSYFHDWKIDGADSQAIMGWTGPGPYKIVNNYLEGAGENVMFGGADQLISDIIPSDIEIRHNHITKPTAWKVLTWDIKNLFELKTAQRVLLEDNIFEYSWWMDQDAAINIKSSNNGSSPWAVSQDVTFRYNIIRHVGNVIKFCGKDCDGATTLQGSGYSFHNNLAYDVSNANWGPDGSGDFIRNLTSTALDLVVNHNTIIHDGQIIAFNGAADTLTGFEFTNNIVQRGDLGIYSGGIGEGTTCLDYFCTTYSVTSNVLCGVTIGNYPAGNFAPAAFADVGFENIGTDDYRLAVGSSYKAGAANDANDGLDMGADVASINTRTANVITGQRGAEDTTSTYTGSDATAVLPLEFLKTGYEERTGTVWNCTTEAEFRTALAGCAEGDKIVLTAGSTYTSTSGNFTLRNM